MGQDFRYKSSGMAFRDQASCDPTVIRKTMKCIACGKDYERKDPYQLTCSKNCDEKDKEEIQEISDKLLWKECIKCNKLFRKKQESSRQRSCDSCTHEIKILEYKILSDKSKKSEIEKWINKKKRKGISLQELIRRMEWKRVFGEDEWNHYLSGRKWDRI